MKAMGVILDHTVYNSGILDKAKKNHNRLTEFLNESTIVFVYLCQSSTVLCIQKLHNNVDS